MSRSGYSDDCENIGLWRGAVESAIRGKRGQALLHDMAAALDAMPVKELATHELVCAEGVCALGAVAVRRKLDVSDLDPGEPDDVAEKFGIARALAREVVYENDEAGPYKGETPAERWTRMRRWVAAQIGEQASPEKAKYTTEHEPEERCTVPPVMCPACGHAASLHVPGHECAGTIYEGGKVCPCAKYQ